ncbi:MAG: METTL5 family protein [Nanoarchaeota archaeon]
MKEKKIMSKSNLAVALSKIAGFLNPNIKLEQYMTDSEVAAEILWFSYMKGDIQDKSVVDLGAGTGIIGLGAALLGAKKVYLVEIDELSIEIAKNNYNILKSEYLTDTQVIFVNSDIEEFSENTDTVIENPPFGVKNKHADRAFLEKAMKLADNIYTLHKSESLSFIEKFTKNNMYKVLEEVKLSYPLKASYKYHSKKIHRFSVSLLYIKKVLSS